MKKLLSLPPNLVDAFHDVTGLSRDTYFCTCDPVGHRLGSGGGTAWLLQEAYRSQERLRVGALAGMSEVGSQAFEAWLAKEKLYEKMMMAAPERLHTMVVSGDVLIRATQPLQPIPDADVVCYGLWLDASVAKNHGVFVSDRRTPSVLKQMLQKPSVQTLAELQKDHFYLTDIGVWLLSDKAVALLMKRSLRNPGDLNTPSNPNDFKEYDLYSEFGCALGTDPSKPDDEISSLKVAILPLAGGEFYHFGTSREMIASTLRLQNLVNDQREIMHIDRKPHPSIFVQNSLVKVPFTEENANIWIENSFVGPHWHLTHDHVITGVPENDWEISLEPGECIDVVPVGEKDYEVRRYRIDEPLNSNEVAERANLRRLFDQRRQYRKENWLALARNWQHSVFYQLDLADAAETFEKEQIPLPEPLGEDAPLMTRIHNAMFLGDSEKAFALLRDGLTQRMDGYTALLPDGRR